MPPTPGANSQGLFLESREAHANHERAKSELKGLMPENAKEAMGHGIWAKPQSQARSASIWSRWRPTMHRSNESVAAIATALAKAQTELSNPEKAMVGTVYNRRSDSPQNFRYAWLSSGLEIIRKRWAAIQGRSRGASDQARHRNRGCLPAHLPRVERIIEPASMLCPCGCGAMTKIGEDVSERLDVIPAQWRVLVTRRPKYACRRCSGAVVQAHAPEHVVPGGLPTETAIAQVIVSKFGDHTPFYRQAGIYARQGIRPIGRRWGTGPAAPVSISSPSAITCAASWRRRIACSWTRPRRRCSLPGAA